MSAQPIPFPNPPAPTADASVSPLSPQSVAHLDVARKAHRPIARAVRVASISAWSLAVFAVLNAPFAPFSGRAAFAAIALGIVAFFEFRGRNALARFDPAGPRILTRNQLALTALLLIYCAWSAALAWYGPSPYAETAAQSPEVADLLAPYEDLIRQIMVGAYAIVALVGVAFQALIIRYYHTRTGKLQTFLEQTPTWAFTLLR